MSQRNSFRFQTQDLIRLKVIGGLAFITAFNVFLKQKGISAKAFGHFFANGYVAYFTQQDFEVINTWINSLELNNRQGFASEPVARLIVFGEQNCIRDLDDFLTKNGLHSKFPGSSGHFPYEGYFSHNKVRLVTSWLAHGTTPYSKNPKPVPTV